MTEAKETKAELRTLSPARMKPLEYQNQHYAVVVEQGTQPEDLERPEFWAHVAAMFRQYDEVSIMVDDDVFFAKAIVVDAGRNYAKLKVYAKIDLTSVEKIKESAFETHEIKWRGQHLKFGVVRKSDAAVLIENLPTKDAAIAWLRSHLQATA